MKYLNKVKDHVFVEYQRLCLNLHKLEFSKLSGSKHIIFKMIYFFII